MSNPVIHFEVQADDVQRAKSFYEKVFGWNIQQYVSKEPMGMEYWVITTRPEGAPGINGGMYKRPGENPTHTFRDTILVDDIDKAIADVKANGGTIAQDKMEMKELGWFARALDTEGNEFGLMQATAWQAK